MLKLPEDKRWKWKVVLAIIVVILLFFTPPLITSIRKTKTMETKTSESLQEIQQVELNQLFEDLVKCESTNNELAINRKDTDGTASFGLLQWKPETFRRLAVKYGVIGEKADWNWTMTLVFDRRVNKKIFVEVMKDKSENPYDLWGNCCRKAECKRVGN